MFISCQLEEAGVVCDSVVDYKNVDELLQAKISYSRNISEDKIAIPYELDNFSFLLVALCWQDLMEFQSKFMQV